MRRPRRSRLPHEQGGRHGSGGEVGLDEPATIGYALLAACNPAALASQRPDRLSTVVAGCTS